MGVHNEPDCCFCFPVPFGVTAIAIIQFIWVCDTIWQGYYWGMLMWNLMTIASGTLWLLIWLLTKLNRAFDSYAWRNTLMWIYFIFVAVFAPLVSFF